MLGKVVIMFLKPTTYKNGRTNLAIIRGYRDPKTGKSRKETALKIGYLDVLEKEYEDPIAHFTEVARKMTEDEKINKTAVLSISLDDKLPEEIDNRKNYGYSALVQIYHELELHKFFAVKERYKKFEYNTNSIALLLVISQILSPGSKKKAFEEKSRYFERFDFSLSDVYRSLSHFAHISKQTQEHLHKQVTFKYGRNTKIVYFDTTNFYFEIDSEDDLRKRGVSKEHRPNPIVQMGLAMDADGVPISYKLFPGNTHDSSTFRGIIGEICRNYETERIIAVGDMGIITGDNIWYLIGGKPQNPRNGYVFSFSVRGGSKTFKEYVISDKDYITSDGKPATSDATYKIKNRHIAREINVTMASGKTCKKTVYEKQVIFWNKKYADKAKADRERTLLKALELMKNPAKYKKSTHYGAAKYINGIDTETGEINPDQNLLFNTDLIAEEEKYDGYYAIVTSELNMDNQQIVDTYRGLWEIEETFRITKGELEARPIFVSTEEHIEAHFLICFISLVIIRLLKKLTGKTISCRKIIDTLNRISCSNIHDNLYLFDYSSKESKIIGEALNMDFSKKYIRLGEIKKFIGNAKK